MKNPYNPITEPASYKWWNEKPKEAKPRKMRTYTEQELILAVKYACEYQKAEDYQLAGCNLIPLEGNSKETDTAIIKVLDELADCENNEAGNITLEDLHEYFDENK